ncbi:MAG: hypothetical protein E7086_01900 [Bacteroidales bacterium]|nr:hypothetical protein [Bacteroidales bacterium]
MLEENKFSYRALLHGKDAEWYFARGLDDIAAAGCYEVRLFHDDMESLGITTADCDKEHYVVAHLFVSESAATGRQQALRVVGQTLLLTICATNAVKAFTRTCEVVPKGASWGSWVDLGAASTTDIQDGSITAQKLSSDIRTSIENPLRTLFIAAGAEYNAGVDKTRIAPWGESVTHKAGHYYLNGLGDITEEQMMDIYNAGELKNNIVGFYAYNSKIRTLIPAKISGQEGYGTISLSGILSGATMVESVVFTARENLAERLGVLFTSGTAYSSFNGCSNLVYIQKMNFSGITSLTSFFDKCYSLVYVKIINLKCNLDWSYSKVISKESVIYTIQNSIPTSAMIVTLHPDAYARLADDADVVAALESQPLVSLVSA